MIRSRLEQLRVFVLFLITMVSSEALLADTKRDIVGKLIDEDELPVEFATVGLYISADSSLLKGSLTDEEGRFIIGQVDPGTYYIRVSYLGYNNAIFEVRAETEGAAIDMGTLQIFPDVHELATTVVTGRKQLVVQQADKMVVNVANSLLAEGNNALELLEKAPGVSLDGDDNIQIRGKAGVIVMINGKRSYLSRQELATFLKSMPAGAISKLEIITNPSARYDAAGNPGIINIVLKKNENTGWNGSVYANYGRSRKNRTGSGVNINYRGGSVNVFGSYDFSYRGEEEYRDNIRRFYEGTGSVPVRTSFQETVTDEPLLINNFKTGIDYYINEKNTIGAVLYGNVGSYTNNSLTTNKLISAGELLLSDALTDNHSRQTWNSWITNVNYTRVFSQAGRELSVDLDYSYNDFISRQRLSTQYLAGTELGAHLWFDRRGNIPSATRVYVAKADYVHPFRKEARIEAGIKSSFVTVDNDLRYDTLQGITWIPDATTSNHFKYREKILAAYASYFKEWKGFSIQAGLRGEYTDTEGIQVTTDSTVRRDYFQLFPSVFLNKQLGEFNQLRLSYSRRINRPDYDDLNPFRVFTDPYLYYEGNPYLQPELSHAVELSHTWKDKLVTTLNYSYTADVINWLMGQIDSINTTYQRPENLRSQVNFGVSIGYSQDICSWWSHTSYANVYWNQYKGGEANRSLDNGIVSYSFNSQNTFRLGKGFSAELSGFYRSKTVYGVFRSRPMYAVSAAVQKLLLNEKATLKLAVNDIFLTYRRRQTGIYENLDMNSDYRFDNRVLTFSFTYRFGKGNLKSRDRDSGSDDIQDRVKSGG